MNTVIGVLSAPGCFRRRIHPSVSSRLHACQQRVLWACRDYSSEPTPHSSVSSPAYCRCVNSNSRSRTLAPRRPALQPSANSVRQITSLGPFGRITTAASSGSSSGAEAGSGAGDSLGFLGLGDDGRISGGNDGGSNGRNRGSSPGGGGGANHNRGHLLHLGGLILILIGSATAAAVFLGVPYILGLVTASHSPDADADVGADDQVPVKVPGTSTMTSVSGVSSGLLDSTVTDQAPQQRLKRLMREAFSDLMEMRLRLEALEAAGAAEAEAEAAGEALVVPLEGFAVRPVSRALAPGLRLRCNAQVSGTVDVPFLATLSDMSSSRSTEAARGVGSQLELSKAEAGTTATSVPGSPAATHSDRLGGNTPSWDTLIAEAGLIGASHLRLRIQSVWGHHNRQGKAAANTAAAALAPLSRRGSSGRGSEGAGAAEPAVDQRTVAAHLQLVTEPGGRHIQIDKLLLKAEAHPKLRFLLATHGSVENIGKNVNPFAAGTGLQRGLTAAMRRGHDLVLLSEGGAGAAVAASAGDLSLAVGAFSGDGAALSTATGDAGAAATAFTTTCAQISLHRFRRVALSAIWSNNTVGADSYAGAFTPAAAATATVAAPSLGGLDLDVGAAEGLNGGWQSRLVQRGLVAAAQLTERLTAAAWVGDAVSPWCTSGPFLSTTSAPSTITSAFGNAGGGGSGRPHDSPWASAAPQEDDEQRLRWRERERRVGFRLATLPDVESGQSVALSVSHRRQTDGLGTEVGVGAGSGSLLVAELSAALPIANGVMLTPGLVLMHRNASNSNSNSSCGIGVSQVAAAGPGVGVTRRTLLLVTAQTTWSF